MSMSEREFWLVLLDETPNEPGSSNRHWRVEFAPYKAENFAPGSVIEIVHVREVAPTTPEADVAASSGETPQSGSVGEESAR